jgi:hypothetical protein
VHDVLQYRIADVDIAIEGPADVLRIVSESYSRFARPINQSCRAVVRIVHEEGQLSIRAGDREYAALPAGAGRGIIGIELSNAIITTVAQESRFLILHAAALERNGEALCIAGRGMSGKTLLATHLVSRGWRVLSDEYAFIEPLSGYVVPFPKLLFVRSSSLPHMPRSFRKCVECSPWYGMGHLSGIIFSGVDPARSYGEDVWSSGARLKHLLLMEPRAKAAQIAAADPWSLVPDINTLVWQPPDLLEGLSRLATAMRSVRTGRLTPGAPLPTANVAESWTVESTPSAMSA